MTTQKLRLACQATVGHLNARKEGPEDDKELACDLKLTTIVSASVLRYFDEGLELALYTPEGMVRNVMIGSIPFLHELEGYRMELNGMTQHGVKIKKFTVQAKDSNLLVLTFSVSFKPTGTEVATLAEFLQDQIDVQLEPGSEELDLGGDCNEVRIEGGHSLGLGEGDDPEYPHAVQVVKENKKPSISLVQRHLKIGYNRAARLLELMELRGVVSHMGPSGSRTLI
jgi:hypothetical protein